MGLPSRTDIRRSEPAAWASRQQARHLSYYPVDIYIK
jgi:hypothetical protein